VIQSNDNKGINSITILKMMFQNWRNTNGWNL